MDQNIYWRKLMLIDFSQEKAHTLRKLCEDTSQISEYQGIALKAFRKYSQWWVIKFYCFKLITWFIKSSSNQATLVCNYPFLFKVSLVVISRNVWPYPSPKFEIVFVRLYAI